MSKIVMLIERVGDELEMSLHEEIELSPADEGTQRERRQSPSAQGAGRPRNREIKEIRAKRAKKNGRHGHPDTSGPHLPIILLDKHNADDQVVFISAEPFVVDVEFDPDLQDKEKKDPRRSPFKDWEMPQFSRLRAGMHQVVGIFVNEKKRDSDGDDIDDTRPTDQMFYKATVWSQGLKLDPDFICDR